MEFSVKEPRQASASEHVGIVLLNHVGSSYNHDSGRDAQAMADTFGIQVIAANRPGTGWVRPRREMATLITNHYIRVMDSLGWKLAAEAELRNIHKVILTGRSAGGLGALALACTEQLPTSHVYAAEPVGWFPTTPQQGKDLFHEYNALQKLRLRADTSKTAFIHPDPSDVKGLQRIRRSIAIPPLFALDRYHNQALWAQPTAYNYAAYIARRLPDVNTAIVFAQHSLVAPQQFIDQLIGMLPRLRTGSQPFTVDQLAYTTHASFDKRSFMATRLAPFVQQALES